MDFDRLINKPIIRCEVQGCVTPIRIAASKGTSRIATQFVRDNGKLYAVCDGHPSLLGRYKTLSYDDGYNEWVTQSVMAQ